MPRKVGGYALYSRDRRSGTGIRHGGKVECHRQPSRRAAWPIAIIASALIPFVEELRNSPLFIPKCLNVAVGELSAEVAILGAKIGSIKKALLALMALHIAL